MSVYAIVIFILILLYTYYMGYNDGANAIASATATRATKPKTAVFVGSAIKFVVPILLYLVGYVAVAGTMSELIIPSYLQDITAKQGFYFLLAALASAMIWGVLSSIFNLPNATTYTLVGGIIGSAIAAFGFSSINWFTVGVKIVLLCFLAPIIGFVLGYLVMRIMTAIFRKSEAAPAERLTQHLQRFNMFFLAGAFAVNNVQKSMGVYMLAIAAGAASAGTDYTIPMWMVVLFSAVLALGMLTGGLRLINTIGRKIFKIRPIHSLASLVTTNAVMIVATVFGLPIAASQVVSTSIIGVGTSERVHSVHWQLAGRIVLGWWLTLPLVATFSACIYLFISKVILGGAL